MRAPWLIGCLGWVCLAGPAGAEPPGPEALVGKEPRPQPVEPVPLDRADRGSQERVTGKNADAAYAGHRRRQPLASASFAAQPAALSPRAFACTLDSLLDDTPCFLRERGLGPADDRRQTNANRAQELASLGEDACRGLGLDRSNACLRLMEVHLEPCALAKGSLRDDRGRFFAHEQACVDALRGGVIEARRLAIDHQGCCTCLAHDDLSPNLEFSMCLEKVAAGSPAVWEHATGASACRAQCAALLLVGADFGSPHLLEREGVAGTVSGGPASVGPKVDLQKRRSR